MRKIQQRYVVLIACAICMIFSFSTMFLGSLPTLMKVMASDNNWSRTEAAAGMSMASLCLALATPFAGALIDRFGSVRVTTISCIVFSALLFAFSMQSGSALMYICLAGMLGIGAMGATSVSYLTVIAKWFDDHLGAAMAVAAIGMGLGYICSPIIVSHFVQLSGWRSAYEALAVIVLIPVVALAFFIREPAKAVLAPGANTKVAPAEGLSFREAIKTRVFWLLCLSALFISLAINGPLFHLVAMVTDHGISLESGAFASSVSGLSVLLARIITGVLLDRFSVPLVGTCVFLTGAAGVAILWLGGGGLAPYIAAVCLGAALGAEGDIIPFACKRYFGLRAYGRLYGLITGVFISGVVFSPLALAFAFDKTGAYGSVLPVLVVLGVMAALLISSLGRPAFLPRRSSDNAAYAK